MVEERFGRRFSTVLLGTVALALFLFAISIIIEHGYTPVSGFLREALGTGQIHVPSIPYRQIFINGAIFTGVAILFGIIAWGAVLVGVRIGYESEHNLRLKHISHQWYENPTSGQWRGLMVEIECRPKKKVEIEGAALMIAGRHFQCDPPINFIPKRGEHTIIFFPLSPDLLAQEHLGYVRLDVSGKREDTSPFTIEPWAHFKARRRVTGHDRGD